MPTINIQGRRVKVDDSFLNLSPEQQNATVEEIAKSMGAVGNGGLMGELSQMSQRLVGNGQDEKIKANMDVAEFNNASIPAKIWQATDDIMRLGANGLTFGLADRFAGFAGGQGTDAERANSQSASNRAGSAGLAADVIGSSILPAAAISRGATLMGRFGTAAAKGIPGVIGRAGLASVEGAGYGAAQAAGRGEDIKSGATFGAIGGGVGSMAADAVGVGLKAVSKFFNKASGKVKPIPELPQLREAAGKAYQAADDAGVIIRPEAMQSLNAQIRNDLAEFGYDPALQGRIAPVIQRLENAGDGNITLKGIDVIRRVANNARMSDAADERKLGNLIISRIDDFIDGIGSKDILAGDPVRGAASLKSARELWRRIAKNEELALGVRKAELRAASTGSGGNTENAIRQNLRRILEKGKGWTPDEKAALEEIVRGTPTQNVLRLVGKLSPSGNGLMTALGVGGAMVNPAFGAASLGGMGAKYVADKGVIRGVAALDELIRSGGSQQSLEAFKGTLKLLSPDKRAAIISLFMSSPAAGARQPTYQ